MDISKVPLLENVSAKDVKISKKEIQAIRDEVKKRKLDMTIIGYLCWVSTQVIVNRINFALKGSIVHNWIFIEAANTFGPSSLKKPGAVDAINALRLFHFNPHHFLTAIDRSKFKDEDQRNLFIAMSGYWYDAAIAMHNK
ncbi:MAG: hypothetical protein WAV73_04505 [Candidatus Moraniibacteriota bacterium]